MNILLLNGPNLNMLGHREPEKYGTETLSEIVKSVSTHAEKLAVSLDHFQSNAEHALIDRIHQAFGKIDVIIFNPGAFTHTSIALRDALLSVAIPFYEVHLSNIYARENFRHHSFFSDIAAGVLFGMGSLGYHLALTAAVTQYKSN
ncbi:type II 3-dehydroquinate dehydratase [Alteromonas ponticola]|uniref:3-dehydroquinate dehydratase n=1 Tax=Alteromonas aquimaris TaxID=2998417 RepID=A0ABT3P8H3_9ALTE|nr:type II 3-dehydroquinate dehydratase [Alteromonas aquimaris]MCW8109076.1 type II 3-dehydroquinate dehydratase [Alteromonas aquimaris]